MLLGTLFQEQRDVLLAFGGLAVQDSDHLLGGSGSSGVSSSGTFVDSDQLLDGSGHDFLLGGGLGDARVNNLGDGGFGSHGTFLLVVSVVLLNFMWVIIAGLD